MTAFRPRFTLFAAVSLLALAVGACSSSSTSSSAAACLTGAPGGKLCGSDAKAFCQNMRLGQSVTPGRIDAQTVRQCRRFGVYLNGTRAATKLDAGGRVGLTFVRFYDKLKYKSAFILASDFKLWVSGQAVGKARGAPKVALATGDRQAAVLVVLLYAQKLEAAKQLPARINGQTLAVYLAQHGVS